MNYKCIHDQIISRAKIRSKPEIYVEKHHIVPKCLGGDDNPSNLVFLTGKEHFIIHKLLCRIYPEEPKITYALWSMCRKNNHTLKRYSPSARIYEQIKIEMSEVTKARLKINNPWNGKKHKKESRLKQSNSAKNRKIIEENEKRRREGISKGHKGKKWSEEHRKKGSEVKLGSKNPMFGIKGKAHPTARAIVQYSLEGEFIREYDSLSQANEILGIKHGRLYAALNRKSKQMLGFIWEYKEG